MQFANMKINPFRIVVVFVLCVPASLTQVAAKIETKTDYSQEAYVIQQMVTKMKFDAQGNRTREQTTRVEVKTDAGVQVWGLLSLPYQSALETVEVRYVRVRKADGTTIATPEDNVQDFGRGDHAQRPVLQ